MAHWVRTPFDNPPFSARCLQWEALYGWQQSEIRKEFSDLSYAELTSCYWEDVDNCMVCGSPLGHQPCSAWTDRIHVRECIGSREQALIDAAKFLREVDAPPEVVEAVVTDNLRLEVPRRDEELLLN